MSDSQLQIIDSYLALVNSRIVEQTRIVDKALIQRDALYLFRGDVEDLRSRLVKDADCVPEDHLGNYTPAQKDPA